MKANIIGMSPLMVLLGSNESTELFDVGVCITELLGVGVLTELAFVTDLKAGDLKLNQ